jgi:HK97 family phage prohead protease
MRDVTTLQDGTQIAEFEFGFTLDGKAVVSEPDENGDVYIEGLASDFGLDRQDEAFEPGAFEEGLKSYMDNNPILLYHHKPDVSLGQVIAANITADGLHVKARVDAPEPGTVIADYVRKIKNGTLRAFSVGGKFYRRMTANGPRIFKCDMHELSVTPLPVNPRTLFAVAGKAFEAAPKVDSIAMNDFAERLARIDALLAEAEAAHAGKGVKAFYARLEEQTKALAKAEAAFIAEGKALADGQTQAPSNIPGRRPQSPQHPDAGRVALLMMHNVKIHTLAEDTHQNAADPEVAAVAGRAAADLKKHSADLHHIAAKIGPLPDYYGALA